MSKHAEETETPANKGVWRLFLSGQPRPRRRPLLASYRSLAGFCSHHLLLPYRIYRSVVAPEDRGVDLGATQHPPKRSLLLHRAGQPWIAHEWLFGLFSFLMYQAAGLAGLIGAKALLVAGLLALTAWAAHVRGAAAGMTVMVLAACYAISRHRFAERPELLSLPIAVAFLLIYDQSRKRPRLILLLPALQLLWVNLHGGTALLGWGLAGAFLLDRAWQLRRPGTAWQQILFRKNCAGISPLSQVSSPCHLPIPTPSGH